MGLKGFAEGGVASIVAGCSTHPFDLIKVRMQLQGEIVLQPTLAFAPASATLASTPAGPIAVGLRIAHSEGLRALFSGVSATVLRQALYSTTRMGLYEVLKQSWSKSSSEGGFPVHKKIVAGLVAGGVGAAVGNPADLAMVRMQADGRLPFDERRNYRGVADALVRMVRQEGAASLWKGSGLTIQRAMVVTASQLATYDQAKESLIGRRVMKEGLGAHITASCAAGLVAAVASNPIDVMKTRIMNMTTEAGQEPPYRGAMDCAIKTVQSEGPMALYKGFVPTVMRQGPFTVVLFVTLEQVRKLTRHV